MNPSTATDPVGQIETGDDLIRTLVTALRDGAPLRRLFDAVPALVIVEGLEGRPIYINSAVKRVLGIRPADEVESLLEFRPPGFEAFVREVILPAARVACEWRGQSTFLTRSGDEVKVSQVTVAHESPDGAPYLCTVARELAAWDFAHDELRRAEERMRFALESAKAGVWEADLRSGRIIWTDSMRAVQGFSNEEFAGTLDSFLALIHPVDRRAVREAMSPTTGRLSDFKIEFRALWPDGTIHWVESHGHVLPDESGNPGRVLGIAFDVTERKQLEEELVAREKRYRLLFNRSLAGVYQSTLDGRLLDCNDAFGRMLGYPSREACLLKTVNDTYFSPQDRLPFIAKLTEQRVVLDFESRLRRADGTAIWVSENASLIEDQAGHLTLIEGTLIDITRRREMEIELRQVQKLESVGRLAAGVAHEINTPVQFVGDSIHFMRDGVQQLSALVETCRSLIGTNLPAEEVRATLARAEEEADLAYLLEHLPKALDRSLEGLDRVATIVRSMKEFAHPDLKEMALVDINRAVASTLTIARNEYKYVADVETEYGDLPPVMCHAGDINQAVLNILVNAAHAISDKVAGTNVRGRIVVRTQQDGDAVLISISDTGGGIPEEIRERIFEPFFTTKEVGRGTGQGLAIARSVLREKHGGDLTFETEPGAGTTFVLRLPIAGFTSAESST